MLHGYVDSIYLKNRISGWVRNSAGTQVSDGPIIVTVTLSGQVVGEAVADRWREDLGGHYGFSIVHDRGIGPSDYLLGIVEVVAKTKTEALKLPIWDGALATVGVSSDAYNQACRPSPIEFATLNVPVGFLSTNRVTIVGKEGFVFVYQGGNRLADTYFLPTDHPDVVRAASEWIRIFSRRAAYLKNNGIVFLQYVIPEKSSVLREYYPIPIPSNNAYHTRLMQEIRTSDLSSIVSDFDNFSSVGDRRRLYTKGNSHFSFEGNQVVLNTILSQARLDPVPSFAMVDGIAGISDLSLHLLGRPMKEQGQIGENATHFFGGSEVQLEIVNDTSQHVGTHYVWRNAKAINKLKVIAFGNSFFDRGTSISCLSWWLARLFSEFHFIWSPDMDFEYINKVKPDVVIGQTIERFLLHPANK